MIPRLLAAGLTLLLLTACTRGTAPHPSAPIPPEQAPATAPPPAPQMPAEIWPGVPAHPAQRGQVIIPTPAVPELRVTIIQGKAPAEVQAWYATELAKTGWQAVELEARETAVTVYGHVVRLYTRDGSFLSLDAQDSYPATGGTQLLLNLRESKYVSEANALTLATHGERQAKWVARLAETEVADRNPDDKATRLAWIVASSPTKPSMIAYIDATTGAVFRFAQVEHGS